MTRVAGAVRPRSLKLFVDHGDRLPFNAHVAYYADAAAAAGDVAWVARLWRDGLPGYLAPLRAFDPGRHHWALDERRSPDRQKELWADLDARMGAADRATPAAVERALRRTTLDVLRVGDGFIVLNYPFFLGGFVDRFLVDVLAEA